MSHVRSLPIPAAGSWKKLTPRVPLGHAAGGGCATNVIPPSTLSRTPAGVLPAHGEWDESSRWAKLAGSTARLVTSLVAVLTMPTKPGGQFHVSPASTETQKPSVLPRTPCVA